MNLKYSKVMLAATMLAGLSGVSRAQTFNESWQDSNPPIKVVGKNMPAHVMAQPAETAASCKVTCRWEVEGNEMPTNISLYNSDFHVNKVIEGAPSLEFAVPAGTYDFLYECKKDDRVQVCVVKEDVVVDKDMEMNFSADEAATKVIFNVYSPDGELFRPDKMDRNYNITEKGNTDYVFIQRVLIHKDCGIVSSYFGDYNSEVEGAELANPFDFLITDVSSDYILAQARLTVKDGVYHVNKISTEGTAVGEVSNNYNDFIFHEEKFNRINPDASQVWSGCRLDLTWKGLRNMSIVLNEKADTDVVKMYLDNRESDDAGGLDLIASPAFADDCIINVYDIGFGMTYSDTIVLNTYSAGNMITADGKVHYVNTGHAANGDTGFQLTADQQYLYLPGHEAFGFTADMRSDSYMVANSTPFVSLQSIVTDEYFYLAPVYIGQYGEVMTQDDRVEMNIKHNGEEVTGDYTFSKMADFCNEWTGKGVKEGRMEVAFSNDNILIGGKVPAHSEALFSFDLGASDPYVPTLQMLQVHDADGRPDNFLETNAGEICIAAGDFNYTDGNYYECAPVVLRLFFRPSGTEEWKEIKAVENPDMFKPTAFGHFYTAQLSDINVTSRDGWFDLKVTCADEAGNNMEQIMCNALYIEDHSGVGQTVDSGMTVSCIEGMVVIENIDVAGGALYTLHGQKVAAISAGQNVVVTEGLAGGVYILECVDASGEHYVCKILK